MADDQMIDPADIARDELAAEMVPTPEDLLGDIGPMGTLWYLQQTMAYTVQKWAAMLSDPAAGEIEDNSGPVRALTALVTANGVINGACIEVALADDDSAGSPV
jgi:hypothetical protein